MATTAAFKNALTIQAVRAPCNTVGPTQQHRLNKCNVALALLCPENCRTPEISDMLVKGPPSCINPAREVLLGTTALNMHIIA
eukprot:2965845-Pyramimonas_sp.AAC.1